MLILILLRRELGGLQWPRVRDALWLRAPRDPKTGRVGGRVWWWVLPFILIFAIEQVLPAIPGPSVRDFADFLDSDRGEDFFSGAWGWYAVVVVLAVFNTVLGEELLFRGLLLPRMKDACRKMGLGRQWGTVCGLPLASAVGHSHLPGGHLCSRVSLATVPERVDGDHRALDSKRRPHHRRPRPRA